MKLDDLIQIQMTVLIGLEPDVTIHVYDDDDYWMAHGKISRVCDRRFAIEFCEMDRKLYGTRGQTFNISGVHRVAIVSAYSQKKGIYIEWNTHHPAIYTGRIGGLV